MIATRDWHPEDHSSFAVNGGIWPVHCVRGTPGAELHPRLDRDRIDVIVDAGRVKDLEGYSGFEDTELENVLREHGATMVHIGGLALDYCVKATALDARRAGFEVVLHRDATRAIDAQPGDADRALEELRAAGVQLVG